MLLFQYNLKQMLLYETDISDQKRDLNNTNNSLIVILATFILLLFLYLFSNLPDLLNLPTIQNVLLKHGILSEFFFGEALERNHTALGSSVFTTLDKFKRDTGFFIGIFILCFLTTYFFPVKLKRLNNIFWYMVFTLLVFDFWQMLLLVFIHLIIYSSFHLRYFSKFLYVNFVRFGLVNIPILIVLLKVVGVNHVVFGFWFVLIFVQQWYRLIIYWCDFRDGYVPERLGFINYLSIFFNLPSIINHHPYIGQSYAYIESNFLSRNKNIIALKGIKLIVLSMIYFIFWRNIIKFIFVTINNTFDFSIFFHIVELDNQYLQGNIKSPFTVIFSAQIFLLAVFFVVASITHFKVGLWNLLGYDIHPQINKPLVSTNFLALWSRFLYHYRAFLFRVFYYPIYERLKGYNEIVRTIIATTLTVGAINFLLNYVYFFNNSYSTSNIISTVPYYFFLTIFISTNQIYFLITKKRTTPWLSRKPFLVNVFFAYIVFSIYSLIFIFDWPWGSNIGFGVRLGIFLKSFGF